MKNIGKRIKACRIELGLSAEGLGHLINKDRATIYRYENGDIENLPTTILEPLAVALKTTPGYLAGWETMDDRMKLTTDDPGTFTTTVSAVEYEEKSTYGNHKKIFEYFQDKPEILETYKEIYENETLQLLFDSARNLEPEDQEAVLKHINLIKAARTNE